ncbi:hypothetical protein V1505DRAFT_357192 [Lipomyces doorenjongii]
MAGSTMISSASLRRGIQKNAAAFGSISRSGIPKRYLQGIKKSSLRNQATATTSREYVRGQRHFPISAKFLNDWNESIKIGHATIHSLPSSSSIDPLPARGINNPGYADHPLAHTPSPEPYPQLPPQYWHQSAPYPALQANYYYPFLAPNYSAIPVPAQDAAPTSFSGATPATANITTEVKDGCSGYCTKEKGI